MTDLLVRDGGGRCPPAGPARTNPIKGGTAEVIEADVTNRTSAGEAVANVVRALGCLDAMVNTAGVMLPGPVQPSWPGDDY